MLHKSRLLHRVADFSPQKTHKKEARKNEQPTQSKQPLSRCQRTLNIVCFGGIRTAKPVSNVDSVRSIAANEVFQTVTKRPARWFWSTFSTRPLPHRSLLTRRPTGPLLCQPAAASGCRASFLHFSFIWWSLLIFLNRSVALRAAAVLCWRSTGLVAIRV